MSQIQTFWKKNKNSWLAISIAILALLLVGGLIIFNIFKPKDPVINTSDSNKNTTQNSNPQTTALPSSNKDTDSTSNYTDKENPNLPNVPKTTNLPVKINQ